MYQLDTIECWINKALILLISLTSCPFGGFKSNVMFNIFSTSLAKKIISEMIREKNRNYDNSKIAYSEIKKELCCTDEQLIIFLNGCQDAQITNRINYNA